LAHRTRYAPGPDDDDGDVKPQQLVRETRELVGIPSGGSGLHDDVLPLDVAVLSQALAKGIQYELHFRRVEAWNS
jgi:hypothetical protein